MVPGLGLLSAAVPAEISCVLVIFVATFWADRFEEIVMATNAVVLAMIHEVLKASLLFEHGGCNFEARAEAEEVSPENREMLR
jgi:hypothetical protein